jgi:hypothetical protein
MNYRFLSSGPARAIAGVLVALVVASSLPHPLQAEPREISARRAKEKKSFTDAQIADGFFKVAFGAELGFGGTSDRIRKYTGPVRVFIDSSSPSTDRGIELRAVIADIRAHIANLDISVTSRRDEANFIVRLVRDRDLKKTVMELYGSRGRQIVRSLEPQCLSGFRKDEFFRISRSDVILVTDAGDFIFYDCAYEEMLQALGPIRDDPTVPWTMFNDKVQMGFFGLYDQYLMNILYHRRVMPGMTRAQVRAILPEIMPEVRAHVARLNRIDPQAPADERRPARPAKARNR